ncbi:MAG TPA: tail fiber domain-containing protein, partial [Rhodothermales bacterium]|nr:tail fiber domain-containing protein [Rhodothermales bacterium]
AKFNAEIANRTDLKNADLTQAANIANLESELKTRGLNDAQKLAYLDAALKAQGLVLTADIAKAQIQQAKDQASKGFWGTVLATVGAVTGAAIENSEKAATTGGTGSDVRMKKDIRPIDARASLMDAIGGSADETRQMLDQAKKAYAYKYRDPSAPGAAPGTHYGPMAQDLEKGGPVGKSLVTEGPGGMKMVDTGRAALVALTEIARMRDELERRKGRAA